MADELNAQVYGPAHFIAAGAKAPGGGLNVRALERSFGRVSLLSLRGETVELVLQPDEPPEALIDIVFLEKGSFAFRVDGQWKRLEARLVIMPSCIHRHLRLLGEWRVTAVRVPRAAMETFVPKLPTGVGVFDTSAMLDDSLRAFAAETMRGNKKASAIESYAVEQLIVEMVGALLLNRLGAGWQRGDPRTVMLDRAMAVIAQQSNDPELTPTAVAREVRGSLRQLQVLFADVGTSIAVEIRRQRARVARSLLRDARYDVLTIDAIAERCGFGTAMSMRRALTDIYGTSPRDIRRDRDERGAEKR